MLSTENPPPDPSDETSTKLKSGNSDFVSSDEKAYLDVDLLKSGLDDTNQTLPKFSIRDYVFSTRSKDIKTHWPFSPKNLQLCLKYGVKNVLPPFETLDSVRNPSSTVKCADEDTSNCSNVGHKLVALDTENIESNSPEEDKELYPSTARSLSCSDVNPVPSQTKSPFLEPEAENLPGSSIEKPEVAVRAHKVKTNNIAQNQVKKCKLIVKLGHNVSEPKSNEDLPLETMASKVCPVCKTFSSSSNTTLNAHIDQCLSGESTIKWTEKESSKVIKHRIKPRKTRLMVDIYLTALSCTLEDLDRRNGTNWATNLGLQAQDIEAYSEEKSNKTTHCSMTTDKNEEGAVYFDSNGTKLRILSKFSDVQPNRNGEDGCGPREVTKRDKGNKVISSKKKNKYVVQRHKLPKSPLFEQRSCSPRPDRCLEVNNAQEMNFPPEETEKEDLAQPLKACDHPTKSNDSGMIKQWVSSKRTGHKKKKNLENKSQNPNKTVKNLRSKSHLILPEDKLIKRTSDSIFRISPDDNPLLATESQKRNEKCTPFNSDDEHMERQPCQTNRSEFSLLDARDCDKKNQTMPSKSNVKRLKEKGLTFSRSNKKMRSISSTVNVDRSFISSGLCKHHSFSSEVKKLSPLNKNPLSISRASVSESNKLLRKKRLDFKKPRLHHTFESHEEAFGRSAICTQNNPTENAARMVKDSGNSSIDRARVLKIRKKRWGFVNTDKDNGASSNHSNASSESNSHGLDRNIDSFMDDGEIRDGFVSEPISNIAFGDSLAYEGHCPPDVVLSGEQEMNKAGEEMAEKVDVNELEGNYFVDVDPIPIPGPPGSFLPSPGRMASEELQGNSSLTTCRIHSSEDERELIDMDSSDSPISDTSFLSKSNSMLPLRSHESQHHMFENRTDRILERSVPFEPKIDESRGKLIIPETNFPIRGDCESPSVSTPVLRLMGKNLMVMSKEENLSPQTRPTQSSTVHDFSNLPSSNIISSSIVQNEHQPFYHNLSRGPPILGNSQTCTLAQQQRFDFMNSSIGSSSVIRSNFEMPELPRHLSRVMLSNERPRSSLEHRDYAGGYAFTHDHHLVSMVRSDYPIRTTDSNCGGKCKEIIVIDDSPENEAKVLAFKTGYRENIEAGCSSVGFSESRHVTNPVYGYPMRCYPFSSGPQMGLNAKTQFVPPFNGSNGNSVNWNIRAPDGPSTLHRDSLTASSPSTGHQKSSLYFSHPGFPLPANFM